MNPNLNTSTWARLGTSTPAHICPECGEDATHRTPWNDLTPYRAHGRTAPAWSHLDGTPLCPVLGERGYQPADPIPKTDHRTWRYTAGWNQPGYLPNPDVVADFDDLSDAKAHLIGELDNDFDLDDDERAAVIEAINALTGPGTTYADGWAWWIHQEPDV